MFPFISHRQAVISISVVASHICVWYTQRKRLHSKLLFVYRRVVCLHTFWCFPSRNFCQDSICPRLVAFKLRS